ncbi:MAG: hypothetical protein JWQ07_457 [Ramlibacter sp.]|nr:hypothetical protein [Ramlibacter sp.]
MNITEGIWRNSHGFPDRVAVIYDGRPMSYGVLCGIADLGSAKLARAGVRRGDVVAISVKSPLAYLLMILAIARMGAVATPFKTDRPEPMKQTLLARNGIRWVIQDHGDAWRTDVLESNAYLDVNELLKRSAQDHDLSPAPVPQDVDNEPWLITLSSGTTGVPKSIPQTHERAIVSHGLGRAMNDGEQRVLVLADLSISMGIGNAMRPLLSGSGIVLTSSVKLGHVFDVIQRDQPTRVVTTTGVAAELVTHAAQALPQSLAMCSSVQVITVAGASVSPSLRKGIVTRICPRIEINYGSSEAGPLALANNETLSVRPESAGRVHMWVQAEAVDEQDQPLPAGQAGVLRFKCPTLVAGYLQDDEANARMFRNGWNYSGDLGSVDSAGYLTLAGRVDHLINIGGRKIDPVQIEQVINSHPAVLESVVVALQAEGSLLRMLVAVVVATAPVEKDELQKLCRERLGTSLVPGQMIFAPTLPKNTGGKVMRSEMAAQLRIKFEKDAQT